jgi:hypothetical protein
MSLPVMPKKARGVSAAPAAVLAKPVPQSALVFPELSAKTDLQRTILLEDQILLIDVRPLNI